MADSKSKEMVKAAIEAMKDKKAEDIRVIDISYCGLFYNSKWK